jgi:hypothetical protein
MLHIHTLEKAMRPHTLLHEELKYLRMNNFKESHSVVKYGVISPKFIWAPVYSCTHCLRTCNFPPPLAFGLIYEGAIGQPR